MFQLPPEEQRTRTAPVIEWPEDYTIVVAGSVRAKDLLMPTRVQPYTERITNPPDGTSVKEGIEKPWRTTPHSTRSSKR